MFPSTRDQTTFIELGSQIATRKLVAFVGAGMSARAGFGNWEELLDKLRAEAEQRRQEEIEADQGDSTQCLRRRNQLPRKIDVDDLSWVAEEIRDQFGEEGRYCEVLGAHFGRAPGKADKAIRSFARLPFSHVFTTNYDRSLEEAFALEKKRRPKALNWREPKVPGEVMRSLASTTRGSGTLVYLHGRCAEPATIVLSERDYRDMYVRSDETVKKLFAIFSLRSVVFVGFSLRDLDVLSIFRQVKASMDGTAHFALMPNTDQLGKQLPEEDRESLRNRYAAKFGVQAIFFDPGRGYRNFAKCMDRLAKLVESPDTEARNARIEPTKARRKRRVPSGRKREQRAGSGLWTKTTDFMKKRAVADPEDPQKGRFGGSPRCNGRELSAVVTADTSGWYRVELKVKAIQGRQPLTGKVDFWVHDSFPREHYYAFATKGVAKYSFWAYGAFTVGATCDAGKTPLELDLSKVRSAPARFRRS